LEELEQEELDAKMLEAPTPAMNVPNVPSHEPGTSIVYFPFVDSLQRLLIYFPITAVRTNTSVEDDEEAELKALQASMAM
jgi:charged multivesicular body protein 4A/B